MPYNVPLSSTYVQYAVSRLKLLESCILESLLESKIWTEIWQSTYPGILQSTSASHKLGSVQYFNVIIY